MIKSPTKLTRKVLEYQKTDCNETFAYIIKTLEPWISKTAFSIEWVLKLHEGYQVSREDCRQEVMMYLIRAIRSYDKKRGKGMQFLGHLLSHHTTYGVVQRTSKFHQFNIPRSVIESGIDLATTKPIVVLSEKNSGCSDPAQERLAEIRDECSHLFGMMEHLLSAREIKFLRMRTEGYLLREVGEIFNLTRERVRQIEAKSYKKIREAYLESHPDCGLSLDSGKSETSTCDLNEEQVTCSENAALV